MSVFQLAWWQPTRKQVVANGTPDSSSRTRSTRTYEMDFPEAGSFQDDTLEAFTHPSEESVDTGAAWLNVSHTTSIEWTPGQVGYYLDGKLVRTASSQISDVPMDWVLQNESALSGAYAAVGAHATIATTWVTCYSCTP
jgi:hypothetical protein